jgi:cytochrome c5
MKKIKLSVFVLLLSSQLAIGVGHNEKSGSPVLAETGLNKKLVSSVSMPKRVEDIGSKWARTCALCHATGVGGAPRPGMLADWQPRLEKGKEVLLTHTIEGFNDMPPLGYCMSCDRDDFSSLIDFMTAELR